MTLPEVLLWRELRPSACEPFRFRRQHPIGPYILDFYRHDARLAVEVDGDSHGASGRVEHDALRTAWLGRQGVRVLRLSARDVLADVEGAVMTVLAEARDPLSQLR